MKFYSIGEFSKKTRKSISTFQIWDTEGKLKPHVSESGHRYYSEQQANQILQIQMIQKPRKVIGYCRVSSNKQKDDLERQIEHVRMYMLAKGYSFEVISDIGSGINYNKKGLNQLIDRISSSEVEKYGTVIEIINTTEKTVEQELVEDLIQIVTMFSCRLQGKRANKAKKMLKELLQDDSSEESPLTSNS